MFSGLAREFLYDELELREFFAGKALLEDGCEGAAFFRKECQVALRATNIPRKNHRSPSPWLPKVFAPAAAITGCATVCRHARAKDLILAAPNSRRDIVPR